MALQLRRLLIGPALGLFGSAFVLAIDHYAVSVYNPSAILLCFVVAGAFFGGLRSGIAGALVAVVFAAYFLATPAQPFDYIPDNLTRLIVFAVAAPVVAAMTGAMRREIRATLARERERIAENVSLRGALDQVEYGVVLLDKELRAQFINSAFRRIWKLPDNKADAKPPYVALMYHGRDTHAYAVPDSELSAYVAERVALVRAGNSKPLDIKLANKEVLRFQCKALPDGGRMLSYLSVTDLFRHAEALETLATVDGMTGVYNRRHFLQLTDTEWSRFQRYNRPLSLLLVDIDHFKSVNDCFGHDAGDAVLIDLARVCLDAKRSSDIVARLGGEEFAILLPETALPDALIVAERLRRQVEERTLTVATETLGVTISVGVAEATLSMSDFSRLLKAADMALYQAKKNGRNRIEMAMRDTGGHRVRSIAAE